MAKAESDKTRQRLREQLRETGWEIQDAENINLAVPDGIAVGNFPLLNKSVDFLLFIDRMAVGVVLADRFDNSNGVEKKILGYLNDVPQYVPHVQIPLPLFYGHDGKNLFFMNIRDVIPSWRKVGTFYQPDTIGRIIGQEKTQNTKLYHLPPVNTSGLWDCQIECIQQVEKALLKSHPRICVRMAPGTGKTRAAFELVHRLLLHTHARCILFITDRDDLGRQVRQIFHSLSGDGAPTFLPEHIQFLSHGISSDTRVYVTTLQELGRIFNYPVEYDSRDTMFGRTLKTFKSSIDYNRDYSIELFDYIIIDDCAPAALKHYKAIFDYFDAPAVGLFSACSRQVYDFFHKNIVLDYKPERAIADGCTLDYQIYSLTLSVEKRRHAVDGHFLADRRAGKTKRIRWAALDRYSENVGPEFSKSKIRAIIQAFKDRLFTEIFPGRSFVPKTAVFARDEKQAGHIAAEFQRSFNASSDFCASVTIKDVEGAEKTVSQFNDSINPRILVTTDIIAGGTNFRTVECVFFFCRPGSAVLLQMMKGRGARTIGPAELQFVSPDASLKTQYIIIDAAGACSNDQTDYCSLERRRNDNLEDLFLQLDADNINDNVIKTLAGRLAKIQLKMNRADSSALEKAAHGKPLRQIIHSLLDVVDPDVLEEIAKELFNSEHPTAQQIQSAKKELFNVACLPLYDAGMKKIILDLQNKYETTTQSLLELEDNENLELVNEKAKNIINRFKKFLQDKKNSINALKGILTKRAELVTYENLKQTAEIMSKHPYCLQIETIWLAYQHHKKNIPQNGGKRAMTDLISLVYYERGMIKQLVPFADIVEERYKAWIKGHHQEEQALLPVQIDFLELLKNYFVKYAFTSLEDLDLAPLQNSGGSMRMYQLFGNRMEEILQNFNRFLMTVPK